jgi:hypothetical protein
VTGRTVVEPPGSGSGWWAGAPTVLDRNGTFYLSYRLRRPRELGRGYETRIAASRDGTVFRDVWRMTSHDLASPSIERCALLTESDGAMRLYVSYVDGADGRWRIDVLEARSLEALHARGRRPVLMPSEVGVAGVKDPCIVRAQGQWHMYVSCAVSGDPANVELHRREDAFASGSIRSATGLATSADGERWRWHGIVLAPPESGWDAYETRITAVVEDDGRYLAFYDGIATAAENYEERTGLAESTDLQTWRRLTVTRPLYGSPHGSGSLRYVSAVEPSGALLYAEIARRDGSHELCVFRAPADVRRVQHNSRQHDSRQP